jgi:hypothetical protein
MQHLALKTCALAVMPLAFASGVSAQTAPAAQPATANYSLESSTLKGPAPSSLQPNAGPYELSGTSISGSTGKADGQAASIMTAPIPANAAPYKTESGIYLYPTVYTGLGFNDNVALTPANTVSSNFINVVPQLMAEMKHKGNRYTALASVNRTIFSDSSPDNSTASEFRVAGDNYFDARARMGWTAFLVNSFDARSPTTNPIAPDKWSATGANGTFIYGAPEAAGRLEFDLGHQVKSYDERPLKDARTTSVAGRVFYRLGTRSLALVEIRNSNASYDSPAATDSNTERRYYAGLTWDATAATTGVVKLGSLSKDFANGKQGFSGASWEASMRWMPLTYSVFDLQTSKSTSDSTGVGTYTLNTSHNLIWNHTWTQTVSSMASVGVLKTDFGATTRADTTNSYSLGVNYAFRRWLTLGVDFAKTDNSSTDPLSEYTRNVTKFTLNASL